MAKVIILAAGEGTRLTPLTKETPKCLVSFFGKTLLEYQLNIFEKYKIKKIGIVVGYKEEKIQNPNVLKIVNKKYKETNMVYSLFSSKDFLNGTDDLIISYGDIIYTKKIFEKLLKSKHEISIVIDKNYKDYWSLRSTKPLDDLESLKINKKNNITELGKKVKSYKNIDGQYIGLIKIKASIIKKLISFYNDLDKNTLYEGKNKQSMYMTTFIQLLIDEGWKIKPIKIKSGWLEFDTYSDYKTYINLANSNKLKKYYNSET